MPIYEYRCKDCGKEYEEIVSVSATEAPPCPSCSSKNTEKKISLSGNIGGSASGSSGGSCGRSGFS
jgi:putative FmdB family regulatory protein